VPLIGRKCYINNNPTLAQIHFGSPLKGAPTPTTLVALVFYYNEGSASEIYTRFEVPGMIYILWREIQDLGL